MTCQLVSTPHRTTCSCWRCRTCKQASPAPGALPGAARVDTEGVEGHGQGSQAAVGRLILQQSGRRTETFRQQAGSHTSQCLRLGTSSGGPLATRGSEQVPQRSGSKPDISYRVVNLLPAQSACSDASASLCLSFTRVTCKLTTCLCSELLNQLEEIVHSASRQRLRKHLLACRGQHRSKEVRTAETRDAFLPAGAAAAEREVGCLHRSALPASCSTLYFTTARLHNCQAAAKQLLQ